MLGKVSPSSTLNEVKYEKVHVEQIVENIFHYLQDLRDNSVKSFEREFIPMTNIAGEKSEVDFSILMVVSSYHAPEMLKSTIWNIKPPF